MSSKKSDIPLKIEKQTQAQNPAWEIYPGPNKDGVCSLKPGECVEIEVEFQCLKDGASSGMANIFLDYEDIPGYSDGQFVLQVEKTPLVYDNNGVGIRTEPGKNTALSVKGSTKLEGNANVIGNLTLNGDSTMSGKVGIGTTTPGEKLDVQGNASVNGNLTLSGNSTISGNVGIGTTTPGEKLDVQGSVKIGKTGNGTGTLFLGDVGWGHSATISNKKFSNTRDYAFSQPDSGATFINSAEGSGLFFCNGDSVNMVVSGGKVGIGTQSPSAKVEIIGTGEKSIEGYGYLNSRGGAGHSGSTCTRYSIYADGRIACPEFNAHCDGRIKKDKKQSDSKKDLENLLKIKITDYSYADPVTHGSKPQKKVIGQQIREVYPQAVDFKKGEVVPDIMKHASSNHEGKIMLHNHGLKVGDRVQVLYKENDEDKRKIVPVREVTEDDFSVDVPELETIFIYGREVDDFHVVDFDALSMLNVSATQELCKQLEAVKKESEQKDVLMNQLKDQLVSLSRRIDKLESSS